MSNPIKIETFCKRLHKCYYYKEKDTYVRGAKLVMTRVLREYSKDPESSFLKIFGETFSSRSYTGPWCIYSNDKKAFKQYCIDCAINIDNFLDQESISNILDFYEYKHKIRGNIGGVLKNKQLNVFFSFKNASDTQKELDIYSLSNYIYNKVKGATNDCLVMSVPTDSYFKINYKEIDYTITRGFISSIIKTKVRRQGDHCINCKNPCKPEFINGLGRLEDSL